MKWNFEKQIVYKNKSFSPKVGPSVYEGYLYGSDWEQLINHYRSPILEIEECSPYQKSSMEIRFANQETLSIHGYLQVWRISKKYPDNSNLIVIAPIFFKSNNGKRILTNFITGYQHTFRKSDFYIKLPEAYGAEQEVIYSTDKNNIRHFAKFPLSLKDVCPGDCPRQNDLIVTGQCCKFIPRNYE